MVIARQVCRVGFEETELSERETGNSLYTANCYTLQYNIWICS